MSTQRVSFRTVGLVLFTVVAALLSLTLGQALASGHGDAALPDCALGGPSCDHIGQTDGWYEGTTVKFQYSHDFFCGNPPSSGASSKCEAGEDSQVAPPSGPVGAELYVIVPLGFSVPEGSLQCPVAGQCIDHPNTIDMSRVFGAGHENDLVAPHSHVIDDDEEGNGVWWPVEIVGVQTRQAWNAIVRAKSLDAVRRQQALGRATDDIGTNLFLWFEVLLPSPD